MPSHHPQEERLVEYSAGGLHEPGSLLIATHLALCPECRSAVDTLDAVGGAVLDSLAPTPVNGDSLAAVMARLDDDEPEATVAPLPRVTGTGVPSPLADYLGCDFAALDWNKRLGGVEEFVLPTVAAPLKTFLLKMGAGKTLPAHTHRGYEMTLVLTGAYTDHLGEFRAGDFVELDNSVTHQPVITDEGDCICLAVTDAPLRFTQGLARLLNPFLKQ